MTTEYKLYVKRVGELTTAVYTLTDEREALDLYEFYGMRTYVEGVWLDKHETRMTSMRGTAVQ